MAIACLEHGEWPVLQHFGSLHAGRGLDGEYASSRVGLVSGYLLIRRKEAC